MWFLAQIYVPLCSAVALGVGLNFLLGIPRCSQGNKLSLQQIAPVYLGRLLFWVGVPVGIVHFVRQADMSGQVWLAAGVAWIAFLIGKVLAHSALHLWYPGWSGDRKGTFLLAAMFGNTGYLGFPVILLLPQLGAQHFGWALFYDLLGTLFGAYGWGVAIAAYHGQAVQPARSTAAWLTGLQVVLKTPTIWAFFLGLALRSTNFPSSLESFLRVSAWGMVMLSLVLMGMRLQQLRSSSMILPALNTTAIRMLVTPFLVGWGLTLAGIEGAPRLALVLQAGMPSAFATLVLTETFDLSRDLAVTSVGISSLMLLLTLPLWIVCFPTG